jgi:lauroyl/myristoyl acyltransferase
VGVGQVRALSGALAPLPLAWVRRLGAAGGRIAHGRAGKRRAMAERHMARILGGDPDSVDDVAREAGRRVFERYGVYTAETLWLRERRIESVYGGIEIEGLHHWDAARSAGRGVILALPHIGNWEFAALHPLVEGVRLIAVAEELADPAMVAWFTEMRGRFGIEVVLAGDAALTRRLLEALRGDAAIALVTDRDVTGNGIGVDFFGERTRMPIGPGALARISGAPLLPVACYLTDDGHRIVARAPIEVPRTSDRRADGAAAVQSLAHEFEDLIRVEPDQWHVLQPQWPSDPGWRWGPVE